MTEEKLKTLKDLEKVHKDLYESTRTIIYKKEISKSNYIELHHFNRAVSKLEFAREFKQEAIKWVKKLKVIVDKIKDTDSYGSYCVECNKTNKFIPKNCHDNHFVIGYDDGAEGINEVICIDDFEVAIKIFKHIFNITDEDLKQGD